MADDIVIALIGFAGVALTALASHKYREGKARLLQAEKELDFQQVSLGFAEFVAEWGSISADVKHLMATTEIDRFIIFRAWNGYLSPRWTTAVYQQRGNEQDIVQYIHVDLDKDYQERVRAIVRRNDALFIVEEMPESVIKSIYMAEGVTASYWSHLHSFQLEGSESRAVIYCSFATHSPHQLPASTLTHCRLISSRLRGTVRAMHGVDG